MSSLLPARVLGVAALALALLAGAATSAQAATTTLYAAPAAAGSGDCSSAAAACSISTAVTNANAASVADDVVIRLAGGTYALPTGDPTALPITFAGSSLTLQADGGTPTLDGGDATRVLSVAAGSTVTVDGLAFENGSAAAFGGAIQNDGALTVTASTFTGNAGANGGAIQNATTATVDVEDSTFTENAATAVGGGAIINMGTATIERSAFVENTAPVNGGAINVQPNATTTVSSSTFVGSSTTGGLGGTFSNLGTLAVQGSTIAGGSASGGSAIATGNASVTFATTIIGAQTSGDACNPVGTAFVDGGYNLDTDGTCISATTPATGSHNGTTAYGSSTYADTLAAYLADAPANNGGPTATIALLNTPDPFTTLANPAFDIVPPSFVLPVPVGSATTACAAPDQRGVVPVPGANCAIGAYLLQATTTAVAPTAATVGVPVTITATITPAANGGTVAFDDGAGNPATTSCAAQPVADGTATCTVTYTRTGTFPVTATYTGDGAGNDFAPSATSPAANVTVGLAPPPPPTPPAPPTPPVPPVTPTVSVTQLSATRCLASTKSAQQRGTVGYTVSAPSRVTFTLQRRVKPANGARSACPKTLPAGKPGDYVDVRRSAARATAARAAGGVVALTAATPRATPTTLTASVSVAAGKQTLSLKQLLGTTTLKPGRYRVLIQATSTAGAKAQNAAYLWVLQPKKPAKAR